MRFGSLLTIVVVLGVRCGDSTPREETLSGDERAVSTVMYGYISAVAHDQFEKACSLLTREARASFRDSGRRQVGKPTCAAGIKVFFDASYTPGSTAKDRVQSVEITGDNAVATANNDDHTKTFLHRVRGKWLLDHTDYEGDYEG